MIGAQLSSLDSPQLLLDLNILDANLAYLLGACQQRGVDLRIHFKSPKVPSGNPPASTSW
jgi:D-serine deaminase-like pyridoxal phosphate-dependent protein